MTDLEQRRFWRIGWLGGGLLAAAALLALLAGGPDRPEVATTVGLLAEPDDVYDPVIAGEPLPAGYRQLLRRDSILPVYEPAFNPPEAAGWSSDTLVIGVVGTQTAKAYPVDHLNRREMVIDSLDGIPVLVTW